MASARKPGSKLFGVGALGLMLLIAAAAPDEPFSDPPSSSARVSRALLSPADRTSFIRLSRKLGGRTGVTVSGIGRGPAIERLGDLSGGVAWSTIKVPLALAVVRRGGATRYAQLLRDAIAASDNQAAEQLWSSLGRPAAAGRAVERALAAGGDTTTSVQTRRVRAGFTAFGQTRWPLAAQQRFVAGLPCVRGSGRILDLMGGIVASQRWGLGSTRLPARFKGGWGPDAAGRYLVRQLGLLQLPNGRRVAVAVSTVPSDGQFATGTRNLTRIARWLVRRLNSTAVPRSGC
jgi:hypothetical protein